MEPLQIDFISSLHLFGKYRTELQKKFCYNNIYHLSDLLRENEGWTIGYGYWGNKKICMVRHCFIIQEDKSVIDPSVFLTVSQQDTILSSEYYPIAEFSLDKYYEVLIENEYDPDLKQMVKEGDKTFLSYAIQHHIPILRADYEKYLMEMDKTQSAVTVTPDFFQT